MPKTQLTLPRKSAHKTERSNARTKAAQIPTLVAPAALQFPLKQLIHGENSRRRYNQRDVEERAASIKESGLLQNLVGYLEGNRVAISAGHTRLEALLLLVKTQAEGFTPDFPVPVLIKPKSEALADSLIENIQRRDLTPLEESQSFAQLVEQGQSVQEIAAQTGKALVAVQKRLRLLELHPEALRLLEEDALSLSQAQALTMLSVENQAKFLEVHGANFDPDLVGRIISRQGFLVMNARFPLERYKAEGGIIHEDLFDKAEAYFDDKELASRLQLEAIAQLKQELQSRWNWVEVVSKAWLSTRDYGKTEDPAEGGAILLHNPETQEVTVYEGMVKRETQSPTNPPKSSEPKPRPSITKSGTERTKTAKTRALQTALLTHPESFKHALVINVMGLLGAEAVRLGFQDQHHDTDTYSSDLSNAFENLAPILGLQHREGERLKVENHSGQAATLFANLSNLPLETLHPLFVALTACAVGSWGGYMQNDPSDTPFTLTLARHLNARVPPSEITDEWLKGLSKTRLEALYAEIAQPLGIQLPAKELRKLLLERFKLSPDYLPLELRFHLKTGEILGLEIETTTSETATDLDQAA